jgi:hypothetical protein
MGYRKDPVGRRLLLYEKNIRVQGISQPDRQKDIVNHNCTISVLKRGGDFLGNLLLNGLAARMAVIFRKKKLDTFVGNNVNRLKMCPDRVWGARRNGPLEFANVVATHLIVGQFIGR